MDSGKHRLRGYTMSSNKRPPYLLLLLLALGAAALSVGVLHKMRERRVFAILLQERDHQLISLQLLLEKEKANSKEMRRKVDELEAKTSVLSIERTELKNKLMDSETTTTYLSNTQKELEATLVEKESHINKMKENAAYSGPDQLAAIKELLEQKQIELEEIKTKLQDYKKSDTKVSDSIVVGTNNTTATADTVVLDSSPNYGDSVPPPAEHSYNNATPENHHQDESIVVDTYNDNTTPDTVVLEKYANPSNSIPAPAEELHSYNTTTSESNHREDNSEEQYIRFTTNVDNNGSQDKTGTANQDSDDVPESEKPELPQWSQKSADNQEVSKELDDTRQLVDNQEVSKELDGTRQILDTQGEVSYQGRESKLLEKENSKEVTEPEKEIKPEDELKISSDSLTEANQSRMQVAGPVVDPVDIKPTMPTNNDETKETSKRHRRRKFRSRRRKRTNVAASKIDEAIKGR